MIYLAPLIFLCSSLFAHDVAYMARFEQIHDLEPVEYGAPLPDELIVPPGNYFIDGTAYDMTKEGLYRFLNINKNNRQVIVYQNDLLSLLSSLTWMHSHGLMDDPKKYDVLINIAKTRKIHQICGKFSYFCHRILSSLGIPCRVVVLLTLEKWNSYNNGHTLLEVFNGRSWELWDVDQHCYFTKDGDILSAKDFLISCGKDEYQIKYTTPASAMASNDLDTEGYDQTLLAEHFLVAPKSKRAWYRHCAQVLLIEVDGIFYFTCSSNEDRKRIESYPHHYLGILKCLEEQDFLKRFYEWLN